MKLSLAWIAARATGVKTTWSVTLIVPLTNGALPGPRAPCSFRNLGTMLRPIVREDGTRQSPWDVEAVRPMMADQLDQSEVQDASQAYVARLDEITKRRRR